MSEFNSKKFLKNLLALDDVPATPTGTTNSFADYMAAHSFGAPSSAANVGLASQSHEDHRGALSKTFGWLGSLGSMAENVFLDAADPNSSFLESVGNAAQSVGAGLTAVAQPLIDLGPIDTPWDDAVSKFVYENNTTRDGEHVLGANILQDYGVDNPVAKYGGGFVIDVLSDPLTYLGVGLPGKVKDAVEGVTTAAKAPKFESAQASVEAGAKAAEDSFFKAPEPVAPSQFETISHVPALTDVVAPKTFKGKLQATPSAVKPTEVIDIKSVPGLNFTERMAQGKIAKVSDEVVNHLGINPSVVKRATEDAITGVVPIARVAVAESAGVSAVSAVDVAEKLSKQLGKGKVAKELNPANQANLYNRLFTATAKLPEISTKFKGKHGSKEALEWRRNEAVKMLRTAENHLIKSKGLRGQHWNGVGLRLSDVLSEVGPKALDGYIPQILNAFKTQNFKGLSPEISELISRAIGRRTAVTGGVAKTLYDDFAKQALNAESMLSPQKYAAWKSGAVFEAEQRSMKMGLTPKEAAAVADLVKSHVAVADLENMEPFQIVDMLGARLSKAMLEGTVDKKAIRQIGKSINRQMGIKNGATDILQNDVRRWIDHELTTWRGRGFMMPDYRSQFSAAQNWAKGRADNIGQIMSGYTKEEIVLAFARAQKPLANAGDLGLDPRVEALAAHFTDYFDNILASPSRIFVDGKQVHRSMKDLDGSMAVRSQATMLDLNKHLQAVGSNFRFRVNKDTGLWLDSWKHANPAKLQQNPAIFMYNLDLAMQRTMAEYNLVDMFVARFGKTAGDEGFDALTHTHPMNHHRIDPEVRFDKDVAEHFQRLIDDFEKGNWRPNSKATQMLTTGLRKWKSSVTIYYPAHHTRNLIGDTWLMWMAGHNDPRVFDKAWKVLGSQRKRYAKAIGSPEALAFNKFIDPATAGWAMTEGRQVLSKKFGSNISADEFFGEAMHRGLLMDASRIEDLQGNTLKVFKESSDSAAQRIMKPFGGKAHNTASTLSEVREHYVRMAHLISYVEKHMDKTLGAKLAKETSPVARSELMAKLFDDAAIEIRKFHPDGTDMSFFEQKYLRNIIPFYSWTRKAIPLTLEAMMIRPGKVLAQPRAMYSLQGMFGIDAPSPFQPFPSDQLYPDWMVAGGIGPIGDAEADNPFAQWFGKLGKNQITPFGEEKGYTVVNPGKNAVPTDFIANFFGMGTGGDFKKGLVDSLTPFLRIPEELIANKTNTGAPISGGGGDGFLSYMMGQVPQTAPIQRVTGVGKSPQQNTEPGMSEALLNMLLGLGITGSGKYTKSAQYDARERAQK